jgi:hypothetical protein
MSTDRGTYSRYQVLCAEREAWHDDESAGGDRYYYDGISFWRLGENGKTRLLPSWRTPAHGWRHEKVCTCDLCTARRPVAAPLSVA